MYTFCIILYIADHFVHGWYEGLQTFTNFLLIGTHIQVPFTGHLPQTCLRFFVRLEAILSGYIPRFNAPFLPAYP